MDLDAREASADNGHYVVEKHPVVFAFFDYTARTSDRVNAYFEHSLGAPSIAFPDEFGRCILGVRSEATGNPSERKK